jgi:hypothetical protein
MNPIYRSMAMSYATTGIGLMAFVWQECSNGSRDQLTSPIFLLAPLFLACGALLTVGGVGRMLVSPESPRDRRIGRVSFALAGTILVVGLITFLLARILSPTAALQSLILTVPMAILLLATLTRRWLRA